MNQADYRILSELHPLLRGCIYDICTHVNAPGKAPRLMGLTLRPHTGYRSPEAQLAAYRAGNSKLKRGKHNIKPAYACDLVWYHDNGYWTWLGPWWMVGYWAEEVGMNWGGRWGTAQAERKITPAKGMRLGWDCPHVELPLRMPK